MLHSLALRALTKRYGEVAAVDNVALTIEQGQFLTLLGPSGSGKTTILMAVAGFVEPTAGDILLDGRVITHQPPEARNFGMVFQGYALFPHLSVAENVGFALKVRKQPREVIDAKVRAALDLVQMGHLAMRNPSQLSGGQQQRVALARALAFEPSILLLDEPLSALDVTHDQEEALSMSDRIAIIRDGRIVQEGPPRELYERPATRFVADFLGKSNFLAGAVEAHDARGFTFSVAGDRFVQAGPADVRAGNEVLIALRPEKIAIAEIRPSGMANAVSGMITKFNYYGSVFHFMVRCPSLGEMAVVSNAWSCAVEPQIGNQVWIGWTDDASVVVGDD